MITPVISIIIPTHNRPHLLPLAVESALAQTFKNIEVIVVDDASTETVGLPEDPRLRVIRLEQSRGGSGARNVGTEAARGLWVTYLDDDDRLLPQMVEVSLKAIEKLTLPKPVGVISGIEVIDEQGKTISKRIPPTASPRGSHFFLEKLEPSKSYNTKQTLVVEREVILAIGGWDETFRSRVHSELFLRLNTACSILGLSVITYQLRAHDQARVSRNPFLRQDSFHQLIKKHRPTFQAHPKMFANFVYKHALMSYKLGQHQAAFKSVGWAITIDPFHTLACIASLLKNNLLKLTSHLPLPKLTQTIF